MIDRLIGDGKILENGKLVAKAKYEVRVQDRQRGDSSHLTGPGSFAGMRKPPELNLAELQGSLSPNSRYTLLMDDGRKLDFFFDNGNPKAAGAIYD